MKNKKILIVIIIIIAICLFLISGYFIGKSIDTELFNDTVSEETIAKTLLTPDGEKIYTKADLEDYITIVPITIENINTYFGERTSSSNIKDIYWSLKEGYVAVPNELLLQMYDTVNDMTFSLKFGPHSYALGISSSFNMGVTIEWENLICKYASGDLYFLNLPEDMWLTNEDGIQYICIDVKDEYSQKNYSKLCKKIPWQLWDLLDLIQ